MVALATYTCPTHPSLAPAPHTAPAKIEFPASSSWRFSGRRQASISYIISYIITGAGAQIYQTSISADLGHVAEHAGSPPVDQIPPSGC